MLVRVWADASRVMAINTAPKTGRVRRDIRYRPSGGARLAAPDAGNPPAGPGFQPGNGQAVRFTTRRRQAGRESASGAGLASTFPVCGFHNDLRGTGECRSAGAD